MGTWAPKAPWTMTMLPGPSYNTETPHFKVITGATPTSPLTL